MLSSEFKEKVQFEKEKLSKMKWKDKVAYLWEYYKLHFAVIAFTLIVIFSALNHFVWNPPNDTFVSIAFHDAYIFDAETTQMTDDINREFDTLATQEEALLQTFFFVEGDEVTNMAITQKFLVNLSARQLDIVIGSSASFENLAAEGVCYNLNEILTPEELTLLGDNVLYGAVVSEDSEGNPVIGETLPYGISLAGNEYLQQFGIGTQELSLIVATNTERLGNTLATLRYILGLPQQAPLNIAE